MFDVVISPAETHDRVQTRLAGCREGGRVRCEPGEYYGPWIISKSMHIDGSGATLHHRERAPKADAPVVNRAALTIAGASGVTVVGLGIRATEWTDAVVYVHNSENVAFLDCDVDASDGARLCMRVFCCCSTGGVEIRGGAFRGATTFALELASSNVRVRGLRTLDNDGGGVHLLAGSTLRVEGTEFHDAPIVNVERGGNLLLRGKNTCRGRDVDTRPGRDRDVTGPGNAIVAQVVADFEADRPVHEARYAAACNAAASDIAWFLPPRVFDVEVDADGAEDLAAAVARCRNGDNILLLPGVHTAGTLVVSATRRVSVFGFGRAMLLAAETVVDVLSGGCLRLHGVCVCGAADGADGEEAGAEEDAEDAEEDAEEDVEDAEEDAPAPVVEICRWHAVRVSGGGCLGLYACDITAPGNVAVRVEGASPNILACLLHDSFIGLAVRVSPDTVAIPSIRRSTVRDNSCGVDVGPGVGCGVSLMRSVVRDNRACGVYLMSPSSTVTVDSDTIFSQNDGGHYGGRGWTHAVFRRACEAAIPFELPAHNHGGAAGAAAAGVYDVVVAPGDSLQAALDSCRAGGSILLLGGVHAGPVLVHKPVRVFGRCAALIASPGVVVCVCIPTGCGAFECDGVAIWRESFVGTPHDAQSFSGALMVAAGSHARLVRCDLQSWICDHDAAVVFVQSGDSSGDGGSFECVECRIYAASTCVLAERPKALILTRCALDFSHGRIAVDVEYCGGESRVRIEHNRFCAPSLHPPDAVGIQVAMAHDFGERTLVARENVFQGVFDDEVVLVHSARNEPRPAVQLCVE